MEFQSHEPEVQEKKVKKISDMNLDPSKVFVAVCKIPWANANLYPTAQALIINGASISASFITIDNTILESARRYSRAQADKSV